MPERCFMALTMFTIHVGKRLYESSWVSVYSGSKMNICMYILGIFHYIAATTALIGESYFLTEKGGKINVYFTKNMCE